MYGSGNECCSYGSTEEGVEGFDGWAATDGRVGRDRSRGGPRRIALLMTAVATDP